MTEIKVKDEGGDSMTMIDFGEFRSSLYGRTVDYIRDVNKHLKDFKFKDGDVLLCSYPKAGCTWTFEMLTMLMKGKPEGPQHSKIYSMLEATSADDINKILSPRILNTHLPYRRIPSDINNKKVKIIFVVRNPKDVAVSLYNMMFAFKHYNYTGKFSNWLPLFLRGDLAYERYLKYLRDWEDVYRSNKHDMLVLYFEELKNITDIQLTVYSADIWIAVSLVHPSTRHNYVFHDDLIKDIVPEIIRAQFLIHVEKFTVTCGEQDTLDAVKKLAQFLDVTHSDELVQDISEKCQFHQMKKRYTPEMLGSSAYKEEVNYGFMRKGEVGNWKEWFTVAQSETVDQMVSEDMKDSSLKFIYQL